VYGVGACLSLAGCAGLAGMGAVLLAGREVLALADGARKLSSLKSSMVSSLLIGFRSTVNVDSGYLKMFRLIKLNFVFF
jgi:hypothetical protein